MQYIYVGEIVNTHGLKGEVRILSDFEYKDKDKVFIKGMNLYVGKSREKLTINTYRKHKTYDMVTFDNISDINDVLGYKGERVYINKSDIKIDGYFNEDIIGLEVYVSGIFKGVVTDIMKSKAHDILVIDNHKFLVPFIDEFISSINLEQKRINIIEMKGLFDED
ncbi:MAG: 16S rRNA processing protein RimM [Bacilli bacterium]|nr:16S rRNA processing protein RimM [Bacilli bacterium]